MKSKKGFTIYIILMILAIAGGITLASVNKTERPIIRVEVPTPTPAVSIKLPDSHQIPGGTQVYQTFNNCGPASLSMALSFYGINATQKEIGDELRPYQNLSGDNDDKSVTLDELAKKAKDYGLVSYHRPNGDITILKKLVAQDIPVIARTLLHKDDDIGHYRVIIGYDDTDNYLVQNDSLQGKKLHYSYSDFLSLWKTYGYEYLVLVPKEKQQVAESILGENLDAHMAWQNAEKRLEEEIAQSPDDIQLKFSLSVAHYNLGEYQKSIEEFEAVENRLPFRTLWYQIEPLLAYQKLKRHDELLPRIQTILDRNNRAFSELYQIRGEIYLEQGRNADAKKEFETALQYNKNFKPAQEALTNHFP